MELFQHLITGSPLKRIGQRAGVFVKETYARARKKNVREFYVTTRENNHEAMKFYQKHGFNKAGILLESNPC